MQLYSIFEQVTGIIVATMASTGFWTYIQNRSKKAKLNESLMMGLAYYRIIQTGFTYIERGWITKDEYDDFYMHLYVPYKAFGGAGLCDRIFKDVDSLPIIGGEPPKENKDGQGKEPNSKEPTL